MSSSARSAHKPRSSSLDIQVPHRFNPCLDIYWCQSAMPCQVCWFRIPQFQFCAKMFQTWFTADNVRYGLSDRCTERDAWQYVDSKSTAKSLAPLVILSPFLHVIEHLIRFSNSLEPSGCTVLVADIFIRVMFQGCIHVHLVKAQITKYYKCV